MLAKINYCVYLLDGAQVYKSTNTTNIYNVTNQKFHTYVTLVFNFIPAQAIQSTRMS